MAKHLHAYGNGHVIPKHHWNFDIPEQLEVDGMVLDTFAIERGHCLVKSIAELVKNTKSFETSVLSGVINQLFLRDHVGDRLVGRTARWQSDIFVADRLECNQLQVEVGEIIFKGHQAGMVRACLCEDDQLAVVVSLMAWIDTLGPRCCRWDLLQETAIWLAQDLGQCFAWYRDSTDRIVVLRM